MSFTASSIMRNGLAIIAGLGVGSAVNMALITLNTSILFPMPPDVSFEDTNAFGEYIRTLPPLAYVVVFAAHYGQASIGGYLAARIALPEASSVCCYVVAGLTMLGSIANTMALPVPAWTWLEIPVFPVLAWYTARFAESAISKGGSSDTSKAA